VPVLAGEAPSPGCARSEAEGRGRRQATGPGGRLFPALDAGIALTPAGNHATRLSLAGAYRPPLGSVGVGLDKAIFDTVAEATIRSLLARIADTLIRPPGPGSAAGRKPA
jgi:hypothetical protein